MRNLFIIPSSIFRNTMKNRFPDKSNKVIFCQDRNDDFFYWKKIIISEY